MTVTDVAFGSAWPVRSSPPPWAVGLLAVSFAVFAVLQAVYVFAGEDTYRDLARGRGTVTFVTPDATLAADEATLVTLHGQTAAYVLDARTEPAQLPDGRPLFDANERAHLADVRQIFRARNTAWTVAGILVVALLLRARIRGHALRLIRDGALGAGAVVLALAIVAAAAFEPAFLAFHYVFFPEGNFLFDPATSNLLRLYPEAYWYGVTLRVGATAVGACALIALASQLALRSRAAR